MRALRFAVFLGSLAAAAVLAAHIWLRIVRPGQIVQPEERVALLETPKLRPQTRVVGVEIAPRSLEQPRRGPRRQQRLAPLRFEHATAAPNLDRLPVSLVTTVPRLATPIVQPVASQPTTAVVSRSRPQQPPAKPASNPRPVPAATPPAGKPPSPPAASPVPPTAAPTPPVPAPVPPPATPAAPPATAQEPAGSPIPAPAPPASALPPREAANPTPPPAEPPAPPSPPPPPEPPPPPTPPPSDRPGWGWGDTNHSHTGPPGGGSNRRA